MTECNAEQLQFHALGRRAVVGKFDGGMISSDGGGLLLGEVESRTRIMRANQIRLYFSSFAYVLLCALRRLGLQGTKLARAQCGTILLKRLKIGARIRLSVRRIRIAFSQSYPGADLFAQVLRNLQSPPACSASP